ncbi:MAG: LysM peptidoglycan-binding domain-containing protein [Myxococcota bacterium]|nr:LysM peptidoglycan-binding domain-containing protein [Myxococcota bacterium]
MTRKKYSTLPSSNRLPLLARLASPLAAAVLLVLLAASSSADENFPEPPGLKPDIDFWVRIYSEVDTKSGLIHDARDLSVVYEKIQFSEGQSSRSRERQNEDAKKKIVRALKKLAQGKRSGLSNFERDVLSKFPKGVTNKTLSRATKNVRFQLGQADKFRAGLIRAGKWERYIESTFREMGLPLELASLPHVESSFMTGARSRVGAAGLWQFTRSTGRRYMRVDHVIDERLDPFEATVAAGRLLQSNKQVTGTWPLALTAYNHGASGMRRATRKLGSSDIEPILRKYKSRTFGFASRNFYVEFLAARHVEENSDRYFGPLVLEPPVDVETVKLPYYVKSSSLSSALGLAEDELRAANPALLGLIWSDEKFIPRGFEIRAPRAQLARPLADAIDDLPADQRYAAQTPDRTHKVRRGDTLSGIAARYGTSVRELASINKLRSRNRIRIGQTLRLPWDGHGPRNSGPLPMPGDGLYSVRSGDSVQRIAMRFGLTEKQLLSMNSLADRNRIYPGQKLRVGGNPKPAQPETTAVMQTPPAAAGEPIAIASLPGPHLPAEAAEAELVAPTTATEVADATASESTSDLERDLLADPSDYSVAPDNSIEVQPTETLGHIAEWLDVRASRLRELNGLRYGSPLAVHRRLKLDFSRVDRATFEMRRLEHHRGLQTEYFERYEITGTRTHTVRRGESIWVLSRRSDVPLWLLQQYNPDLEVDGLHAGAKLVVPIVRKHRPN